MAEKNTDLLRAEKLRRLIDKYNHEYYVLDRPTVEDSVYDSLLRELIALEKKHPNLKTIDSPTQRVGGEPLRCFKKTRHAHKMLSLNDAFSKDDLFDWEKRILKIIKEANPAGEYDVPVLDYFCELKIDGLSVMLTYEDGVLKTAATRGNGNIGEDVTNNIRVIPSVPLRLKKSSTKHQAPERASNFKFQISNYTGSRIDVRGEVYMSNKVFEEVNQEIKKKNEKPYANPRNLAAGTLRQLDPKVVKKRKLESYVYEIYTDLGISSHAEKHKVLDHLGFKTSKYVKHCKNLDEVLDFCIQAERERSKLPFQVDGVVVIVNNNKLYDALGSVGKAPRGAIAYKFAAEQATTKIISIEVNVGRTGALTPFVVMEPVQLAGTRVTRATLHNEDEIKRKDIRIGDTVVVQKAGDIIPEVVRSLPEMRTGKEKKFKMPKKCPVCGGDINKPEGEAVARCMAKNCFSVKSQQIAHFVSRDAFNIEGLGEEIINQLIREGLVSSSADIFNLKKEDIKPLERFAEKSAQNLINSIDSKKDISLNRFIYALGIRHVGIVTASDIASFFGDLEFIKKAKIEDFEQIEGVGPVAAKSISDWFIDKENIELINKFKAYGVKIQNKKQKTNNKKLAGLSFVITGTLSSVSRKEAEQKIRSLGGRASFSVSKNTTYLVVGENPGSKLKKAKELGVRIIDESGLINLF